MLGALQAQHVHTKMPTKHASLRLTHCLHHPPPAATLTHAACGRCCIPPHHAPCLPCSVCRRHGSDSRLGALSLTHTPMLLKTPGELALRVCVHASSQTRSSS